mgnify:CR=1 FL=1
MAEALELKAWTRARTGKGGARASRREGCVPGVLYGDKATPLTIDADAFKTASGDVESSLRLICEKVHAYGDIPVGKQS